MPNRRVINADAIRKAGALIENALDQADQSLENPLSAEMEAARREADPLKRSQKMVEALKRNSESLRTRQAQLKERSSQLPAVAEDLELDLDAQTELQRIKQVIQGRIRKRVQEVMAQNAEVQAKTSRRPPPRGRISI